jgi:hypothetical protein
VLKCCNGVFRCHLYSSKFSSLFNYLQYCVLCFISCSILFPNNLLKEMEEKMTKIKNNLKASQDRKKIYAYKNRVFRYFKVGKHVFLKVKEKISSLRLGIFPKLAARYCGPFEIFEKIGPVAYMLALSTSMRVRNLFHVSLLNKYVLDPNHIID